MTNCDHKGGSCELMSGVYSIPGRVHWVEWLDFIHTLHTLYNPDGSLSDKAVFDIALDKLVQHPTIHQLEDGDFDLFGSIPDWLDTAFWLGKWSVIIDQ